MYKAIGVLMCMVFVTGTKAWTDRSYQFILADAHNLMPENLKIIQNQFKKELILGVRSKEPHVESREVLVNVIVNETMDCVRAIRERRKFKEAVFKMGRIAKLVALLNHPFQHVTVKKDYWKTDFDIFLEKKRRDFRIRWSGIEGRPHNKAQLKNLLDKTARRMKKMGSILIRTFSRDNKPIEQYDVRSIPFGISSISYSNAVSNTAYSWLCLWDLCGGIPREAKNRKHSHSAGHHR